MINLNAGLSLRAGAGDFPRLLREWPPATLLENRTKIEPKDNPEMYSCIIIKLISVVSSLTLCFFTCIDPEEENIVPNAQSSDKDFVGRCVDPN